MTLNPTRLGADANNYIGKSLWPDPYLDGAIDEFRIYNGGLSAAEIAATAVQGVNVQLSTNHPVLSGTARGTSFTLTWPMASAGYTLQSRTNLSFGNWLNVTSPVPQIVAGQGQATLPISASPSARLYRLLK